MRLLSELKVSDARIKIASKVNKTNQKTKQLRDGYVNAQIKQRQYIHNIARTKHK